MGINRTQTHEGQEQTRLAGTRGRARQKPLRQFIDHTCHPAAGPQAAVGRNRAGCYENKPSAAGSCVRPAQLCSQAGGADLHSGLTEPALLSGR